MTYLVDVDLLLAELWPAHLPGVLARPEHDVAAIDSLPLLLWSVIDGGATDNGALHLAQIWEVRLVALATQTASTSAFAAGKALSDDITRAVDSRFPRSRVPGVGVVVSTEMASLFTKAAASSLGSKDVVQFDGVCRLLVRPA